jgi:uncharacterized protein with PQ loop repeat
MLNNIYKTIWTVINMIVGIIGLVLIAIAWIPQIAKMIREKKSSVSIIFPVLYSLGSIALAIHSFIIDDLIFIILNSIASVMGLLGLFYSLKYRKLRPN